MTMPRHHSCPFNLYSLFADKRKSMNGEGNINKQQKLVYNPEEHEFGLLPEPLHFGRYMREKRIAFQLPYDLWWLGENGLVSVVSTCNVTL